jgi:tRNA (guanine37-N1)-methyltransferase
VQNPPLKIQFLTLFPEIIRPAVEASLLGKASQKGLVDFSCTQIRDFAKDKHRRVDDAPYGGGEGMLLKADVLYSAWKRVVPRKNKRILTVLMSPQGKLFDQKIARELTLFKKLVLVCGHYEGVDERFIKLCVDREISIGNYILTGGELPALVVAEAVTRLLPGVLGNERSLAHESLEKGLLKHPQYTRPQEFKGLRVPDVLLSGDLRIIEQWQAEERRKRTLEKRPDLCVAKS